MYTSSCSRTFMPVVALLSLCLFATGCSTFIGGSKNSKNARGSVYLEEVADWSFEASHPAVIDQTTMLKVVKGLYADDAMSVSAKMSATGGKPMRLFSDEDAEFIAPLLAQGLSQAKPEQIVGFNMSSSAGSGVEPMAGTLYVQQGAIHLSIVPSRSVKGAGFMPSSIARIEKAPSYAAGGSSAAISLVIDYQALAKAPMPAPIPAAAVSRPIPASQVATEPAGKAVFKQDASASIRVLAVSNPSSANPESAELNNEELLNKKLDELRQAREANEAKSTEIKVLRKEVAWMKRELRERTDEIKAMQTKVAARKPAPKKKIAEARPTR